MQKKRKNLIRRAIAHGNRNTVCSSCLTDPLYDTVFVDKTLALQRANTRASFGASTANFHLQFHPFTARYRQMSGVIFVRKTFSYTMRIFLRSISLPFHMQIIDLFGNAPKNHKNRSCSHQSGCISEC